MRDDDLFGRLVAVAVLLLGAAGLVAWGGARLASLAAGNTQFHAGVVDGALAWFRLPAHLSDPRRAWPAEAASDLPGPLLYWAATLVAVAVAAALGAIGLTLWERWQRVGPVPRERLGVNARAWFARRRDLLTLLVPRPQPGRFVLGRFGRHGLVATECRATTAPSRRMAVRRRQGDTGAVALMGPSRSGKTVAAVAGILEWEGPAILSSVKADLMSATIGWRATRGEVRIYDPLGLTPYAGAGWSPLAGARSITGARRAARNLLEAMQDDGTENLGMWKNLAEYLMAGLFWVAAAAGRDMATVLDWVLTQDRPRPNAPSELDDLLRDLLESADPVVAAGAPVALNYLLSTWEQDERPRSSVYITAQAALSAFSDPAISAAARTSEVDLEWLMSGENTLYVCSPLKDQARLAPAFGGLINDLMGQIYEEANRAPDGRLDRQVLVVLDEAGNQRLDQLPEYASTVAGLGVQLVTVWQSLAQVTRAYGRGAGIVLTNHLSKVFFAGLSDQDSLDYVARVLGEEEVESREFSGHWLNLVRPHLMERSTRVALVQAHCLRQMLPGQALLVHGTLPPAHIQARRYYEETELRARAGMAAPPELQATTVPQPAAAARSDMFDLLLEQGAGNASSEEQPASARSSEDDATSPRRGDG